MRSAKEILRLCAYEFRVQFASVRVWLGYLIGIVLVLRQTAEYLAYAAHFGEPVNVLEGFLIAGNSSNTVMFLVLGWLLVISGFKYWIPDLPDEKKSLEQGSGAVSGCAGGHLLWTFGPCLYSFQRRQWIPGERME